MDADAVYIGRLEPIEAFNSVNVSVVCRKQELRRQKEDDGRLKSTKSSSELNNKGCPLICIKDQRIPLLIFQHGSTGQAGESGPNGQSVTVVSYDHTGHGLMGLVRRKISRLTF